ncbi:MAG: hypothetical protein KGI92_01755 [Alphaproteobacteria bacterium]|nr:hypothetical protein [Alphaproteobacteria bacterium]
MMALLVPSLAQLAGWAAVGFAALMFIGLGRLVSRGRALPEIALIAGWGVACWILTIWGVALPISLRVPAIALTAAGLIGLIQPRSRLTAADWRALGRVLLLSLPLLAVMVSARPSQPDTFLNLLPNAAYLYDHGLFPAAGRPAAHSLLPAAPYNLQFVALIAGLVTPQFPFVALIAFNVALQLAAGLLLARLVADSDDRAEPPGWSVVAFGLLLATALNPGFVPRYHLSGYSEPSVTVVLAIAGYLALRRDRMSVWLLAAALAALVEIKQDSVALALGIMLAASAQPPDVGGSGGVVVRRAVMAAIPAGVLYAAWTWYVHAQFASSDVELTWMPLAQWQWHMLPMVLRQIARIVAEKVVFFGPLLAVLIAFIVRAWRRAPLAAPGQRTGLTLLVVALVYNAALLVSYIGHFSGQMAADAHSFFRYNTHLTLLLMVTLVLMLRAPARAWFTGLPLGRRQWLGGLAIAVFIGCPVAFLHFLRFDLETPQLRAWDLAKHLAAAVGPDDRVALILPGDGGSLFPVLEGLVRMTPPRRPNLVLDDLPTLASDTFAKLTANRWALISCTPSGMAGVPEGEAALFAHGTNGWTLVDQWRYPPADDGHWSRVIALAPLCLPG